MTDESSVPEEEPRTTLVQIDDAYALVFGPQAPEGFDLMTSDRFIQQGNSSLSSALEGCAGWGNLGAQAVHGFSQAQGLVKLAPRTLEALKMAKPMTDGGWNIGTLVARNGRFVEQIRWAPIAAAQATTIVASAGTAIALLAIQAQLSRIEGLVQKGLEATGRVLEVIEQDQRSRVVGTYLTLREEIGHARELGKVSPGIWTNVRGLEDKLRGHWELYRTRVADNLTRLKGLRDHKERKDFLLKHGQTVAGDCQLLLMAHDSWLAYQVLRVGSLLTDRDDSDHALAQRISDQTRSAHSMALSQADALLDLVSRELKLMAALDGKRTLPFGKANRANSEVRQIATVLHESLSQLTRGESGTVPSIASPAHVFEGEAPPRLVEIVTAKLERDETLLGIVDAWDPASRVAFDGPRYAILTDQRFMLSRQSSIDRFGDIEAELPLAEITEMKTIREASGKLGAMIQVSTPDSIIAFEYRHWTVSGPGEVKATAFTSAVRTQLVAQGGPFARAEENRVQQEQQLLKAELRRRRGAIVSDYP